MDEFTLINPETKTIWDFITHDDSIYIHIIDKNNGINITIPTTVVDGLVCWGKLRRAGWFSVRDDLPTKTQGIQND